MRSSATLLALGLCASACSFSPGGEAGESPDPPDAPDAAAGADAVEVLPDDAAPAVDPDDIGFVASEAEFFGTDDLVLADGQVIDTTALTIDGAAPAAGIVFDVWPDGTGRELAVLHVRGFEISAGAVVVAVGDRPLAVLAGDDARISGTLDAGARAGVPGPGGFPANEGPGRGNAGEDLLALDGGGGGGGFAGTGAPGGHARFFANTADGGPGGVLYGEFWPGLSGGSGGAFGGGSPMICLGGPGAGGGGVFVYSATQIVVDNGAGINVGGGGGGGGETGDSCYLEAGNGGGSGGAIFLQSPAIANNGVLAANGGGGGGGSGIAANGQDGDDGSLSIDAAAGGPEGGAIGGAGGAGGTDDAAATAGQASETSNDSNGGGGGGSVGRVFSLIISQGTAQ